MLVEQVPITSYDKKYDIDSFKALATSDMLNYAPVYMQDKKLIGFVAPDTSIYIDGDIYADIIVNDNFYDIVTDDVFFAVDVNTSGSKDGMVFIEDVKYVQILDE